MFLLGFQANLWQNLTTWNFFGSHRYWTTYEGLYILGFIPWLCWDVVPRWRWPCSIRWGHVAWLSTTSGWGGRCGGGAAWCGQKKTFVAIAVWAENVISFTFDWKNTHVQRCCSGGCGWHFLNELVFSVWLVKACMAWSSLEAVKSEGLLRLGWWSHPCDL